MRKLIYIVMVMLGMTSQAQTFDFSCAVTETETSVLVFNIDYGTGGFKATHSKAIAIAEGTTNYSFTVPTPSEYEAVDGQILKFDLDNASIDVLSSASDNHITVNISLFGEYAYGTDNSYGPLDTSSLITAVNFGDVSSVLNSTKFNAKGDAFDLGDNVTHLTFNYMKSSTWTESINFDTHALNAANVTHHLGNAVIYQFSDSMDDDSGVLFVPHSAHYLLSDGNGGLVNPITEGVYKGWVPVHNGINIEIIAHWDTDGNYEYAVILYDNWSFPDTLVRTHKLWSVLSKDYQN